MFTVKMRLQILFCNPFSLYQSDLCVHSREMRMRVKSWWSGFIGSFRWDREGKKEIETYCWWINEKLHNVCTISNCNQIGLSFSFSFCSNNTYDKPVILNGKQAPAAKKKSADTNSTKVLIDFWLTTFFFFSPLYLLISSLSFSLHLFFPPETFFSVLWPFYLASYHKNN
jgi:hypothetical protein